MGQQHDRDVAGGRRDGVEVAGIGRARVDHDRPGRAGRPQHPGVGAVEGHRRRVGREHARGHRAERPTGPRVSHGAPPAARRARSGTDSVASSPSPSTAGREHLGRAGRGRGEHRRPASACCATSRQVRYVGGIIPISPASTGVARARAPTARSPTTTRSTRRGCAARPAARPRRTRCGSAAARTPACTSADHAPSRSVRSTRPRRSRNVGERQLLGLERRPVGLPVVAGRVGDDLVGRRPGQQHARLLERLAHRGAHQRARHLLVEVRAAPPSPAATGRPTPRAWSKSRGSTPPPGKTHIPPANAIDVCRRSR